MAKNKNTNGAKSENQEQRQSTLVIHVEKGIPIPPRRGGREKYGTILRELEISDSHFFDMDPKKLSAVANNWKKRLGMNFTVRHDEKDGVKGSRIWRIEEKVVA